MVKHNRKCLEKAATVTTPCSPSPPKVSGEEKVQPGRDFPVKVSTQSKGCFRNVTPRLKIKLPVTPHPKKSGGATAKRPAPTPAPEIGRTRKKIIFEPDTECLTGSDGGRPGKKHLARPGPFEACDNNLTVISGHLPLLDHERIFALGSEGDEEVEMVRLVEAAHMEAIPEEITLAKAQDIGEGNQGGMVLSGEVSPPELAPEMVAAGNFPTANSNMREDHLMLGVSNLEAGAQIASFGGNKSQPLESEDVDYPNCSLLAACACVDSDGSCTTINAAKLQGVPHACDSQNKKEVNPLLSLHENASPKMVVDGNFSNGVSHGPCHVSLPHSVDGEQHATVGEPQLGKGVDENSPELRSPPDKGQNQTESPLSKHHNLANPEEGAAESGDDSKGDGSKTEPVSLESVKDHEWGTAGNYEGTPSLSFSDEETKFLANKLGFAIIGKFSHSIPSPHQIQKTLANIHFVDGFKWKSMNAKHILIQFRDVSDYAKMLNGPNGSPVWHVDDHPMRVFKWTPDFDTFFESPIAAVWCKLIGIPIHLFEQSALRSIGKLLGKPIQADHATINQTRLTFARICVEIDISSPPPEEIILNILGKDTRYKVVWDRIPTYCVECKHVGHVQEECLTFGRKKVSTKDHNHAANPRRSNSRPNHTRREWRPKGIKADDISHQPDHTMTNKEEPKRGAPEEGKEAAASTSLKATTVTQVQVDEDGFQLVSRRKKGKMNFLLLPSQEGPHKAPYLEKLLKGGNVATVSFGESDVGVIDPGGSSTVLIS